MSNRFLIQDVELIVSPELFVANRANGNASDFESVAIFASSVSNSNRPLRYVEGEAESIVRLFQPTSIVNVYSGNTATKNQFLNALGQYDLVHFGGHGEVNLKSPLNSRLVIGATDERTTMTISAAELYAYEAEKMPRLIVLAACDSAAYTERLPHALAMVRPLLSLGAGAVIGSLRPIPDSQYLKISTRFYEELRRTGDAATALHNLQLTLAASDKPGQPGHWASIQVYQYL